MSIRSQVLSIFLATIRLPAAEWAAFAKSESGEDGQLANAVLELLSAYEAVDRGEIRGEETFVSDTETFVPTVIQQTTTDGNLANDKPSSAADRYRILRPHAAGGLGTVSLAQDTELNRNVALKEIQARFADDEASRSRFLLEAEVTGGLEHPGIVPVYGMGQYEDGRPFYAMRFIKGDSLRDAADQFHRAKDGESTRLDFASVEFRKLLGRFVDVCQAIEYAHSRGVLHRDLKPGNIMLGKYGETLVVDWGLAKTQGDEAPPTDAGEAHLQPISASGTSQTVTGSALGTPAFMPPEQAAGRLEELGAASDVYSLGATLYYMLTGRKPFSGKDLLAVLADVQAGRLVPPREVQPTIPKALEAVCRRAMQTEIANRYASPLELSEEIERFLADEPVLVYAEPLAQRIRRWLRKHQTLAASTAAVLFVTIAGLMAFSSIVSGKNAELTELNGELDSQNETLGELNQTLDERNSQLDGKNTELIAANQLANTATAEATASAKREREQRNRAERALYLSDIGLASAFIEDQQEVEAAARLLNHYPRIDQRDGRGWEWFYLLGLADPSVAGWIASPANVPSIDWSFDGNSLATTHWDGLGAVIWDAETGEKRMSIPNGETIKVGVDWHPTENRLAWGAAVNDAKVRILEVESGDVIELDENTGSHRHVRWSPNGDRLVVGAIKIDGLPDVNTLVVWQKQEESWRTLSKTRIDRGSGVAAVEWNPSGSELLVAVRSSFMSIMDADSLKVLRKCDEGKISAAAWHPSKSVLACGNESGELLLVDAKTMEVQTRQSAHLGKVNSVAWSPDGKHVASGSDDRSVKVWSANELAPLSRFVGHRGAVTQVCWRADSSRLASTGNDGRVLVWPLKQPAAQTTFVRKDKVIERGIRNRPRFVWVDEDTIRFSHTKRAVMDRDAATGAVVNRTEATSRGRLLSQTHVCRVSGMGMSVSPIHKAAVQSDRGFLKDTRSVWPNLQSTNEVVFSRFSNNYLPTGRLRIRDLHSKKETPLGSEQLTMISDVQWAPDQSTIVAAGGGMPSDGGTYQWAGWVNLFDAKTGKLVERKNVGNRRVLVDSVAWSPDSESIVAGNKEGHCHIFETPGLESILRKRIHRLAVQSLSWHPSEDRIASGGADRRVSVWDSKTGDVLLNFDVENPVVHVAWSPKGQKLGAMDEAGRFYIWNAESGARFAGSGRVARSLVEEYATGMLGSVVTDSRTAWKSAQELVRLREPLKTPILCLATLLASTHDDVSTVQQCAERLLAHHVVAEDVSEAHLALWTMALVPNATQNYELAIENSRRLLESESVSKQRLHLCLAMLLMRNGDQVGANNQLAMAVAAPTDKKSSPAYLPYVRALFAVRSGNKVAAEKHLAEAKRVLNQASPSYRRLANELLRRQIEAGE
ncbi:MAG: protein kinase [Planctomycetaceae bacterium]